MPSIRARAASIFVAWKFHQRKHANEQGILDDIKNTWQQETTEEVVPTKTAETFVAGSETWQVYHVRPRDGPVEVGKVIVYFHGGESSATQDHWKRDSALRGQAQAGCNFGTLEGGGGTAEVAEAEIITNVLVQPEANMQERHWIFIQKLADELKCDVIVPIYTLAPLATGTSCIQTCIELLAHLERDDVRYRNKHFVLTGDSAGGWIALRVLLALVERHTGKVVYQDRKDKVHVSEMKLKQPEDVDYKAVLDSISDVLMISPVVDAIVDRPEDLEAEKLASPLPRSRSSQN
ncbi:hypothetical protein QFC22_001226 [Naganishia vaughanmartiniae]|uniref:Uncharacterized protein n=1 Tax=Naganishia vaughanmartiniae TaxID=1424756 RepID=A0ACC2XGI3_9TREE|nr:hypothetical protein QFC22_001226 [Naganishia vaughanmartiniae]